MQIKAELFIKVLLGVFGIYLLAFHELAPLSSDLELFMILGGFFIMVFILPLVSRRKGYIIMSLGLFAVGFAYLYEGKNVDACLFLIPASLQFYLSVFHMPEGEYSPLLPGIFRNLGDETLGREEMRKKAASMPDEEFEAELDKMNWIFKKLGFKKQVRRMRERDKNKFLASERKEFKPWKYHNLILSQHPLDPPAH